MTESTPLAWALELANRGFLVFPLQPDDKVPVPGVSWTSVMTRDPVQIQAWFKTQPNMNYGVCPGDNYAIVDLDTKAKANGVEAFGLLELEHGPLNTFRVNTPSGGQHLYLSVKRAVGNAHSLGKGIDVRGAGGYVVGPGCSFEGRPYVVSDDLTACEAPEWVEKTFHASGAKATTTKEIVEVDTPEAISRAMTFLRNRDPAVEGLGGDHHTLMTAMGVMDYGVSQDMTIELLVRPFKKQGEEQEESWNDRCEPPWDVNGRHGTLEEKVTNAWRYRLRDVGIKGGGFDTSDLQDIQDIKDIAELNEKEGSEGRFANKAKHVFTGAGIFNRGKRREFIIPEWIPAHGIIANLARRGGGKTVLMLDMGLRIACDMDWHGCQVKEGYHVVYLCGEDDEGAEEQIRAWCKKHEVDYPPNRFIFSETITDLMDAEDVREWAEYLKDKIGQNNKAMVFMDTWQRASSKGGQNNDEDMQRAIHHAEALGKSLNGPVMIAFHPPKADDTVVLGSSIIENSTVAIITTTDFEGGKKMEVTRMKGKGMGNFHLLNFEEVGLEEEDDFGNERTGIVPVCFGGTENQELIEIHKKRKAVAEFMHDVDQRRVDEEDGGSPYTVLKMAEFAAGKLTALHAKGDKWATPHFDALTDAGIPIGNAAKCNKSMHIIFRSNDEYDFGDGTVLKVYRHKSKVRVKVERGGIAS